MPSELPADARDLPTRRSRRDEQPARRIRRAAAAWFLPAAAWLHLAAGGVATRSCRAAEAADAEALAAIRPVLQARCYACHGALQQQASLRVDRVARLLEGGDSGPAVVPGDPDASLLMRRVAAEDAAERMPPEGPPLSPEQIASLRRWIAAGAPAPADDAGEPDPRDHWAFRPPRRPEIPWAAAGLPPGAAHPIDAFLAARRRAEGVGTLPPADPGTLLRRVHLDLTGLPPTIAQWEAFTSDPSPEAWTETVERLLASTAHAERWARHWMDVWRYSDWYGRRAVPDVMNSYPMIWRWRDWIIESLRTDKPYDRMIVEMLAADEVAPDDPQALAATGYLVRSWFKWNYDVWKKDLVEHTGKAFLGLTLNCCQCHDHKYDPLTQEDYFRFRAFFEPLELRHDRLPGEPDPGPFVKYVYAQSYGPIKSGMVRVFDEQLDAPTYMFLNGDARLRIEGRPPVAPGVPALWRDGAPAPTRVALPLPAAYPGMKPFVRAEERALRAAAHAAARSQLAAAQTAWNEVRGPGADSRAEGGGATAPEEALRAAEWGVAAAQAAEEAAAADSAALELRIAADDLRYATGRLADDRRSEPAVAAAIEAAVGAERAAAQAAARRREAAAKHAVAAAEERLRAAEAAGDAAARDAARQQLEAARAEQQPAAQPTAQAAAPARENEAPDYAPLSPRYPQESSGRRSALARWIASRENPLTARVAANHIWLRHFGQPLVASTHDFGRQATPPSHPELLDWLACELMDSGWSMRHVHRLIVTSAAYRQASDAPRAPTEAMPSIATWRERDPGNLLLWRFPDQRMQAEVVRDSLLAAAGALDPTIGGHEIDLREGLRSRRRSIYFSHHGEERMEFLELFDAASPMECYQRTASVQPQQALALANSELCASLSRELTRRLTDERAPSEDFAQRFVQRAFVGILNRAPTPAELQASVEFLTTQQHALAADGLVAEGDRQQRCRENLVHALLNHHDFVTIR